MPSLVIHVEVSIRAPVCCPTAARVSISTAWRRGGIVSGRVILSFEVQVGEHIVCCSDLLELLFVVGAVALTRIRMVLLRKLVELKLDLGLSGCLSQAEQLVVVEILVELHCGEGEMLRPQKHQGPSRERV